MSAASTQAKPTPTPEDRLAEALARFLHKHYQSQMPKLVSAEATAMAFLVEPVSGVLAHLPMPLTPGDPSTAAITLCPVVPTFIPGISDTGAQKFVDAVIKAVLKSPNHGINPSSLRATGDTAIHFINTFIDEIISGTTKTTGSAPAETLAAIHGIARGFFLYADLRSIVVTASFTLTYSGSPDDKNKEFKDRIMPSLRDLAGLNAFRRSDPSPINEDLHQMLRPYLTERWGDEIAQFASRLWSSPSDLNDLLARFQGLATSLNKTQAKRIIVAPNEALNA
jgi:hypothetical protein